MRYGQGSDRLRVGRSFRTLYRLGVGAAFTVVATMACSTLFQPAAASQPSPRPTPDVTREIEMLRERQDDQKDLFNLALLPLAIVTSILGAGGVVGIVLSFRSEIRAGQLHDLVVSGESAQQARTEESHAVLLDASQKTLTLVNDTLELARDASERASKTLSQRAKRQLEEISDDTATVLVDAENDEMYKQVYLKVLVEDPPTRNELGDLAQRLASIEGYLDFQEIPLSPEAFLVKGLAHHLKQDEKRAIKFLTKAAEASGSEHRTEGARRLSQFAYFWAGYACNNTLLYSQAALMFGSARRLTDATAPLHLSLARMEEESRFFEATRDFLSTDNPTLGAAGEELIRLLARLKTLEERCESVDGSEPVARDIAVLAGNIHFWLFRVGGASEHLIGATECFKRGGTNMWAQFGLQQVLDLSPGGARRPGRAAAYEQIASLVTDRLSRRAEPRSQTLLRLTLVHCLRAQSRRRADVASAAQLLTQSFGDVDSALTLFSHHWKTNVKADQFKRYDLDPLTGGSGSAAKQTQ